MTAAGGTVATLMFSNPRDCTGGGDIEMGNVVVTQGMTVRISTLTHSGPP